MIQLILFSQSLQKKKHHRNSHVLRQDCWLYERLIVLALCDIQLLSLAHIPVIARLWRLLHHFCWRLYRKIRKWYVVLSERNVCTKCYRNWQELFSEFPASVSPMLRKHPLFKRQPKQVLEISFKVYIIKLKYTVNLCYTCRDVGNPQWTTLFESMCLWNLHLHSVSPIPANIAGNACCLFCSVTALPLMLSGD